MSEVGFQPRNTPAERRAFFDLDRRVKKLEAAGGVVIDWTEGQPTYDPRYVNESGDTMEGPLVIAPASGSELLKLMGATQAYVSGWEAGVRAGYLSFQAASTRLTADTGQMVFRTGAADRLQITAGGDVNLFADPTVALGVATKQYVDQRRDRVCQLTVTNQSIPNAVSAGTLLVWDNEDYDALGWHAPGSPNIIPTVPGRYRAHVHYNWQATSTNTRRIVEFWFNGASFALSCRNDRGSVASPGAAIEWSGSLSTGMIQCNGLTDSIAVNAYQSVATPASQTISARVFVEWVRP